MENNQAVNHHLAETGSKIAAHTLAVVIGAILMIVGLSLGVTMVLLPLGIPLGLLGLLVCLWGLFGTTAKRRREGPRN